MVAKAKKENIVTDLITEGDNPVIKAKPQRHNTIKTDRMSLSYGNRFNGAKRNNNIKWIHYH